MIVRYHEYLSICGRPCDGSFPQCLRLVNRREKEARMAVMVTGTGFVGSYVVRDLLNAGEEVVLYGFFGGSGQPVNLDLPDLKFLDYLVGGGLCDKVKAVVGDIAELSAVTADIERNDVRSVVHLASKV